MLEKIGRIFIYIILCIISYFSLKFIYAYNDLEWKFGGSVFWLGFAWAFLLKISYDISSDGVLI